MGCFARRVVFCCCTFLQICFCDKLPVSGTKQAGREYARLPKCEFPQRGGHASIVVPYNATTYACVSCKKFRTLVPRAISVEKICRHRCDGVICEEARMRCVRAKDAGHTATLSCYFGRGAARPDGAGKSTDGEDVQSKSSQIPLIIGFTIGGILLAIVVAGIFLGRHQKSDDHDVSEVMTTPVSLSNSEWHTSGGSSSARRREENLRVQEASTEDLTALPMYAIQGFRKGYQKDENGNEYPLKSDDASSVGRDSYRDSELIAYFPQEGVSPMRSNRSSDVILEDGYVPGGNFVGSADPQMRGLLSQAGEIFPNENGGFVGEDLSEKHYFDGQVPGSMTHDSICMSLTHSADYGGMEYVIEDQDLVAFDAAPSFSKHKRTTPLRNGMRILEEDEENVLKIHLHYKDGDSDFGDNDSNPNSAVKSDKGDVFFSSDMRSPDGATEPQNPAENPDKPHVDSGIEGSYNSKDSREINLSGEQTNYESMLNNRSWNDNHKGRSSEHLLDNTQSTQDSNGYIMNEIKSKSFSWKSPKAPKHSSSRKHSAPIHCPSLQLSYPRPQPMNLTHVFVDVHRNMASSDEDLLTQSPLRVSVSDSDASSIGDVPLSAFKITPEHLPFDAIPTGHMSPASKLAKQQRNKSMYVLRNGRSKRSNEWAPRTVRFSSSGSGEYAIPFGSLVP